MLVPEPGVRDNGVVTGRYAIARFNLEAVGRPSHAGARLADGRSAIREHGAPDHHHRGHDRRRTARSASAWCVAASGSIASPPRCTGEVLSMAKRQEDLDQGVERMLELSGMRNDVRSR